MTHRLLREGRSPVRNPALPTARGVAPCNTGPRSPSAGGYGFMELPPDPRSQRILKPSQGNQSISPRKVSGTFFSVPFSMLTT